MVTFDRKKKNNLTFETVAVPQWEQEDKMQIGIDVLDSSYSYTISDTKQQHLHLNYVCVHLMNVSLILSLFHLWFGLAQPSEKLAAKRSSFFTSTSLPLLDSWSVFVRRKVDMTVQCHSILDRSIKHTAKRLTVTRYVW